MAFYYIYAKIIIMVFYICYKKNYNENDLLFKYQEKIYSTLTEKLLIYK